MTEDMSKVFLDRSEKTIICPFHEGQGPRCRVRPDGDSTLALAADTVFRLRPYITIGSEAPPRPPGRNGVHQPSDCGGVGDCV